MRRPLRQTERSDLYGSILDPRPTPAVLADARGRKAETATERDERERRKRTKPAPKGRRRGPRGTTFELEDELDETG